MKLVQVAEEVYVDPDDISSVQREIVHEYASSNPSDGHKVKTFDGSRIILKNGRKVFVDKVKPEAILLLIKEAQ